MFLVPGTEYVFKNYSGMPISVRSADLIRKENKEPALVSCLGPNLRFAYIREKLHWLS